MEKVVPFLWFDDQAEEAAKFYVSVFSKRPGAGTSRVRNITHYGEAGPRPAGMVMTVDFELEGYGITALNGGPEFSFTEALSLAVNCESQQEVDYLWTALSEGGEEGPCGWLKDRYGLPWQDEDRHRRARAGVRGGPLAVLRDRSTAHQAAPRWLVAPRLPIHGNQPKGAGPSRITPRTWSTDTPSHGNSTSHHVAAADA